MAALAFVSAIAATGCSSRRPLEAWKQDVTRFVIVEGNGDPNCLRDVGDLRSRRTARPLALTVSSIEAPETRSRDAGGLLVGQCTVGGRPWYVFLVGIIDHDGRHGSDVESVRPVAFTADAEGLHWFTPRSGDDRPSPYLKWSRRQKDALATRYASFPGPRDVFTLESSGAMVTISEKTSGARWTMVLPTTLDAEDRAKTKPTTLAHSGSAAGIRD